MDATLIDIIKKKHLEGLIGRTHLLILQCLILGDKTYREIFKEIEGKEYVTSYWQAIRATDQLSRIGCTCIVGTKRTVSAPVESIFAITDSGKLLLQELRREFCDKKT